MVICNQYPYQNRKYILIDGKKRLLKRNSEKFYSIDISETQTISKKEMTEIPLGGDIVKYSKKYKHCKSMEQARALFYSKLKGRGVEFGAAAWPSPIPLNCSVQYADIFSDDEGCKASMNANEYVIISYHADLCDMNAIEDDSLDFIIHNHVFEHAKQPTVALEECYKKLKKGGRLMFIVPNKKYTFDKHRKTTSLLHMILDYYFPSKYRDLIHIIEVNFSSGLNKAVCRSFQEIKSFLKGKRQDLHWHTYTEKSFAAYLHFYITHVRKWNKIKITPTLFYEGANEFMVEMVK